MRNRILTLAVALATLTASNAQAEFGAGLVRAGIAQPQIHYTTKEAKFAIWRSRYIVTGIHRCKRLSRVRIRCWADVETITTHYHPDGSITRVRGEETIRLDARPLTIHVVRRGH